MIELHQIDVDRAVLAAMSTDERDFAILGGHALNTLSVWVKLLKLANDSPALSVHESEANRVQIGLLERVLAAAVVEARAWLKRDSSRRIIEEYLPRLTKDDRHQYELLSVLFESPSLLVDMRNRFSSHFPSSVNLGAAFDQTEEEGGWTAYVSEHHTTSVFIFSEVVVGYGSYGALQKQKGSGEAQKSPASEMIFKKVLNDTICAANYIGSVVSAVLSNLLIDSIPGGLISTKTFKVDGAPKASECLLPFFIDDLLLGPEAVSAHTA